MPRRGSTIQRLRHAQRRYGSQSHKRKILAGYKRRTGYSFGPSLLGPPARVQRGPKTRKLRYTATERRELGLPPRKKPVRHGMNYWIRRAASLQVQAARASDRAEYLRMHPPVRRSGRRRKRKTYGAGLIGPPRPPRQRPAYRQASLWPRGTGR